MCRILDCQVENRSPQVQAGNSFVSASCLYQEVSVSVADIATASCLCQLVVLLVCCKLINSGLTKQ